jgi:cell division protein FtsQ
MPRLPAAAIGARRRRAVLVTVLALSALTGAWLWVRDSSLVAVREVRVSGLAGPQSREVRAALDQAAREMTTLHVRDDALRAAAEPYPVVRDLRADADLPGTLRIEVDAHAPVAAVEVDDRRTAIAGDGTLLPDAPTRGLPAIRLRMQPAVARVTAGPAARLLALLAAAPGPLRARAEDASVGSRGLSVELRDGPRILFGDGRDAEVAWLAAARVLADEATEGASYVDVRVPARPAVGGLPRTVEPADEALPEVEAPR